MSTHPGLFREGFRRTWHYQRVLWFIYLISLVLGHFAASPMIHKLDGVTDHSLHARRLSDMFDYGSFSALSSNPQVKLFESSGISFALSFVFLVIMLFLAGGILEAYRSGRKLTTREFFEACGAYFWRWVRLAMLLVIALVPVLILVGSLLGSISFSILNAAHERAVFRALVAGAAVLALVLICFRLWFDMAQVRAVVEEESGMVQNALHAFKLTFTNFRSLFSMFFVLSLLNWLVLAAGIFVWSKLPPSQCRWTLLILEIALILRFGIRLWQRACEMVWYQRRFLASLAATTTTTPAPDPLLSIIPAPVAPPQT